MICTVINEYCLLPIAYIRIVYIVYEGAVSQKGFVCVSDCCSSTVREDDKQNPHISGTGSYFDRDMRVYPFDGFGLRSTLASPWVRFGSPWTTLDRLGLPWRFPCFAKGHTVGF